MIDKTCIGWHYILATLEYTMCISTNQHLHHGHLPKDWYWLGRQYCCDLQSDKRPVD